MKVVFCSDVTKKKPTEEEQEQKGWLPDRELPADLDKELEDSLAIQQAVDKEFEPTGIINFIGGAGILGVLLIIGIFFGLWEDMKFVEIWQNVPWLFYAFGGCLVVSVLYVLHYIARFRRASNDEKVQRDMERIAEVHEKCYAYLGASEDDPVMDILSGYYRIKDGEVKIKPNSKGISFNAVAVKAFVEDDALCLAVLNARWKIPLADITGIHKVSKRITMSGWNKETQFNKGEYKQFKMALASGGGIILPYHYSISFTRDGEEGLMYIPPYELEAFEKLTGITAQEI